jgi:hypothetical protein
VSASQRDKECIDDPTAAEIAKFHCIVNDDYEDVAYNDIVDYIEHDDGTEYGNSRRSSDISAYNLVTQIIWDPCTTQLLGNR